MVPVGRTACRVRRPGPTRGSGRVEVDEVDEALDRSRPGPARGRRRCDTDARIRRQAARGSPRPRAAHTPAFHSVPRGMSGQASMPSTDGPHGLPDVDERGAGDQHVGLAQPVGDAGLLAAGHQVVDQHPEPAGRPGPELGDGPVQVVDPVEALDDHALDPQVVAPHPLDQFGVVDALDPDPAPARATRAGAPATATDPEAVTGGRPAPARPAGRHQAARPGRRRRTPRGQPEDPLLAGAAPQLDAAALDAHQGPR